MAEINLDPRESFSKVNPKLQIAWDSVSLGAAKKCWRYYQITIVEGWRPKHESHHLRYGQLYHRAGEFYDHRICDGMDHESALIATQWDLRDGCTDEVPMYEAEKKAWASIVRAAKKNPELSSRYDIPAMEAMQASGMKKVWWNPFQYLDEERAAKETKTIENLFRTVIWYLDQYGVKDVLKTYVLADGRPAVELSFRYELGYTFTTGEQLLHSGHLDKLANLGDSTYFVDKKTSKNTISGNSAWGYFKQFSPNNQMTGYYFAGKVAISVKLSGGIIDAAQIAKSFSRFERGFITRTDAQLDEWREDVIHYVKLAEHYAIINYWPQNDTACDHYGGCPLRDICNKDPAVRPAFLQRDFKKELWDPLKVRGDI